MNNKKYGRIVSFFKIRLFIIDAEYRKRLTKK